MNIFDCYTSWSKLPRPGPLGNVFYDAQTREHGIALPKPHPSVENRIVFFTIPFGGIRCVSVSPRERYVRYHFPANAPIAAYIVDEFNACERSVAGPIKFFRAVRKAPPKPDKPRLGSITEVFA